MRHAAVLAWLRMARVFQKITIRSERFFRTHGLNTAQFDVLAQIGASGEITQQGLADALLVTKGNISQLLARMERDDLITRRQEGRVNVIALTARGEALRRVVVPQQEAQIARLLAPLTPTEQRELLRLLRKLDRHLDH
ncbi:MAG: MarR family winged helix-turn-helix transcriptional regulator [Oscillochloridaceae bacterium umkhey_bin13]